MSTTGDALGTAINTAQNAIRLAFRTAHPAGVKPLPTVDELTALLLSLDKAKGNAIETVVQLDISESLAHRPRIFVGTDPQPDPGQFQNGDIYFLREA